MRSDELVRRPDTSPGPAEVLAIVAGQRARRLPYVGGGITGAVGLTTWSAAEAAAGLGMPTVSGTIIAGTWATTAVSIPALRVLLRQRIPPEWRRRWTIGVTAAALWTDIAAISGPLSWPMAAALVGGTAAVTARWNAAHEVPVPSGPPLAIEPPEATDEATVDSADAAALFGRWQERVAGGSKPVLASALLTGLQDLPNAVSWTIDTGGDFTFEEMFRARDRLAARLGVAAAAVVLERVESDEGRATLTIVTRDVLKAGVAYTGPRYEDGRIPVALAADGTGWVDYVAVDSVGARPGLVVGEPGSGKTALLEAIVMGLRQSGRWRVLFTDGDPAGGSSPLLNKIAHWPGAGAEDALRQLRAVEDLIEARSRLKPTLTEGPDGRLVTIADPTKQQSVRELLPSRDYPGYVWVCDEFSRLTNAAWLKEQDFVGRVEEVVRIGRKYGVVVLVGTQSLLAGDYGNSTGLRAYLAARNAWVLRTGNKSEQHTINGIALAPGTLPQRPGYAYAAGSGRLSLARVAWAENMGDWASGFPVCRADRLSELAVARHRPQEADAAESLRDQLRRLAEWEAAMTRPGPPGSITSAPAHPTAQQEWAAGGAAVPAPLTASNVVALRRAEPAGDVGPGAVTKLSPVQADALAVIAAAGPAGTARNADILAATTHAPPAVSQACARLVERGLATRLGQGVHQVTAAGLVAAKRLTARPTPDPGDEAAQ